MENGCNYSAVIIGSTTRDEIYEAFGEPSFDLLYRGKHIVSYDWEHISWGPFDGPACRYNPWRRIF